MEVSMYGVVTQSPRKAASFSSAQIGGISVAVVFDLVSVRIGDVDGALAAAAVDGDSMRVKLFLQALDRRRGDFEADVLQALVARRPLVAADKVQKIARARRAQEDHARRVTKGDFQSQNFG